jgi:hypothetical protein
MMQSIFIIIAVVACFLQLNDAFHLKSSVVRRNQVRQPLKAVADFNSLLTAAADIAAKPDNYEYGAVNAPGWVLPIGAVFVVLTGNLYIRD